MGKWADRWDGFKGIMFGLTLFLMIFVIFYGSCHCVAYVTGWKPKEDRCQEKCASRYEDTNEAIDCYQRCMYKD